jgi:hypothetical protein
MDDAFQVLLDALNGSGIRHMVGGSIASSAHGVLRSTNDVDIVADIREEHIPRFAAQIAATFYADKESMIEALQHGRCFNVIHFATGSKFDIFPAAGNSFIETQIQRSKPQQILLGEGVSIHCPMATAEDILLAKLAWYRAGGEQSERQWNDVRGIRSVQGPLLDMTYMRKWAGHLKVDDLLERLFSEADPA